MDFGGFSTHMGDGLPFDACYPNGFHDFHHLSDPFDVLADGYPSSFDACIPSKPLFDDEASLAIIESFQGNGPSGYSERAGGGCMQPDLGRAPPIAHDIKPLMALGPPDELSLLTGNRMPMKQNGGRNRKKSHVVKGQWTLEEDRLLVRFVEQYGLRKWSHIAQMLHGRIGKQCRERWHNHLRPNIKKDTWSEEEDRILIQAHSEIGNKWAEIAKRIPGRTENSIKNHWNATKRRQFARRRCRKYPKSGSLLQNYIKSLALNSPAAAAVAAAPTDERKSTNDDDLKTAVRIFSMAPKMGAKDACCVAADDCLFAACDFSGVADLLIDDKAAVQDVGSMFNQLGWAPGAGGGGIGFEMDAAWGPDPIMLSFDNVKREMDLVEMIGGGSGGNNRF